MKMVAAWVLWWKKPKGLSPRTLASFYKDLVSLDTIFHFDVFHLFGLWAHKYHKFIKILILKGILFMDYTDKIILLDPTA